MQFPSNKTFDSKVIVVPGYLSGFTHSGDVLSMTESYQWINRGDPISLFQIKGKLSRGILSKLSVSKAYSAPIRSPVSGLILSPALNHKSQKKLQDWELMNNPSLAEFAILLPNKEEKPESSTYIYSEMCQLIEKMKHYYFKDSRYHGMSALSEETLEKLIKLQMTAQPLIFDAFPVWSECIDDACKKRPELSRLLMNLELS